MIDKVSTEIHRLSHQKLAQLQNEATAYFDRIVRNFTALSSRSFELLDRVYKLQASSLVLIKYKVKHSVGVSAGTYSNTYKYALHGKGQGMWNYGTN